MGESPISQGFTRRQKGNILDMPFPDNKASVVQVPREKVVKKVRQFCYLYLILG